MNSKRLQFLFLIWFAFGCAKVETLNLKSHQFNKEPNSVIWFQIAGLDEEHLAMLRFNLKDELQKTSFENSSCIGKAWSYNLFNLRPGPRNSFQSQLSSHKNISGSCKDFNESPFWEKAEEEKYLVGIFENGAKMDQSFIKYSTCESNEFSKNFIVWSMTAPPGNSQFNYFTAEQFVKGQTYYDSSCKRNGICYSNLQGNIQKVWEKFSRNKGSKVFIIRDYSYLNKLMKKDILGAREILTEIEKIHRSFKTMGKNMLILVSSGSPRKFEFPRKGVSWAEFERSGRNVIYRRDSLLSPVFAYGNSAENFCGLYNESEIGQRVFWTPKVKKLKIFR